MVESVKDYALFTLSPEGYVTSWNTGAETVFGYSEGEMLGRDGAILFTLEDRQADAPAQEMQTAREHGQAADERWHVRKDGRRFFASGMLTPIRDESGNLLGYTKVARDITDRKRAEDALREADRQKDEFLAMLAHELRNPLAPIANALHIMKARPDREHGERARSLVERQVRHLSRLVDDLLDISRITTGKIQLRTTEVNLAAVVARAIEDVRPLFESKGHRLRVHLSPDPMYLEADPTRLEQLFSNLLNNAAKYTDPGGEITVTSERQEAGAVVSICDTGAGIHPELLPEVFKLFRQADRTLARSEGGLGIGLTVVKRLVELHGGEVRAESEGLGKGSTISVRLPLLQSPSVNGAGHSVTMEPGAAGMTSGECRVLVVDDNQDMRESLVELLELSGYETREAGNGATALEVVREFHPTVVLLDIGLPGKDGYQIAREVREMAPEPPIRLIALSGYGRRHDMELSREAGFDHHLVKPVEFDQLLKLIRTPAGA
jgi:PAS domain S-box-containing protein